MSALAGALTARVTMLGRDPARDDLGAAGGAWIEGETIWARIAPEAAGPGDDAGPLRRWTVTVREPLPPGERIAWTGGTMRVRGVERDPARPDRVTLRTEDVR
ncbi:head-tail adaptor protein [Sphingomonas sp.]|uniref:head-tail adaptor protein n=1 Tax=Sphingomonas sp. TaxID=28214 RepID=UPI003AFFA15F